MGSDVVKTAAKVSAAPTKRSAKSAGRDKSKSKAVRPPDAPPKPVAVEPPPQPAAAAQKPAPAAPQPKAAPVSPALPGVGPEDMPAVSVPDFDALAHNMGRLVEEGGKALAAYLKPRESGEMKGAASDEVAGIFKTLGKVGEHWMSDPARALRAQTALSSGFLSLWGHTLRRLSGEPSEPVTPPAPGDKRFADPEWRSNPMFDFLAQAYTLTTKWADDLVTKADTVDAGTRDKAQFYVRQIASALSPSNFVGTNPELMRETMRESGENLVRGMHLLAEDIEAGGGNLKIRQTDVSKFSLGVNLAMTPGKVVYRNDLIELIQYAPTTETVYRRPLLIVPPWINKFYILDLNPEKSFIRWCVSQGLTVFVVSWVNPDARHAAKSFEHYMREGIFEAIDAIAAATGERDVTAIGYCVGGTLLAVALAYMAATERERVSSATFFTTQVDFSEAGDLKIFADEEQISATETEMAQTGYLEGSKMAGAFNMLRPNDLIWSYVVNNYLKGKEPMPFDLLTWNSDSTRMPAANHSFYLRNCYLENNLTKGEMVVGGLKLDLGKVKIPVYNLAAKEDHIAPAKSVFTGAQFFGGPMRYVMSGSGHIAGVVNPPGKTKYQYWTGEQPSGKFEDWVAKATETPGSWWPDWIKWIAAQAPEKVPARVPGEGKLKPLADAPGTYVRVKA